MSHTPRPWECESPDGKGLSNEDDFGQWWPHLDDFEREETYDTISLPIRAEGKVIALVVHADERLPQLTPEELKANARLISASPELLHYAMLEAEYTRLCDRTRPDYSLDEWIEWLKDHGVYETGEPVGKWLGRIRTEAIRKATQGKSP